MTTPQLAAFGGPTLLETPVHVGQPNLLRTDKLMHRIEDVLRSGQLTNNGPLVREFEASIAARTQTRHCIAICNATTALQILARAMDLSGEVIMPSFTFIATAHAMEWIGLTPVFADVDPITHTLDVKSVHGCLTSRTSAILGVHVWGHICETDQLAALAQQHSLHLLFDACHAFGCSTAGQRVGSFGDAEIFSFHATKFVHAFEGGAIVTNNDELAARCRRLRAFGITGLTEVSDVGINGKMHELSAAAGLHSLECLPQIMLANLENRELWQNEFATVPGLQLVPVPHGQHSNAQYVVVKVDSDQFGLCRDQLVALLRAEGLFVRSYFAPGCHRSVPYQHSSRHTPVELPRTESLVESVLQFPTGPGMEQSIIQQTGRLLRMIQGNAAEIQRVWRAIDGHVQCHCLDPGRPPIRLRDAA